MLPNVVDPLHKVKELTEQVRQVGSTIASACQGLADYIATAKAYEERGGSVIPSQQLTMSFDFLLHFMESAPVLTVELIPEVNEPLIIKATRALEIMFEYRPGELIGKPISILIPPAKRESHKLFMAKFIENPIDRQMGDLTNVKPEGITRTGRVFAITLTWGQFFVEGHHCLSACMMPQFGRQMASDIKA